MSADLIAIVDKIVRQIPAGYSARCVMVDTTLIEDLREALPTAKRSMKELITAEEEPVVRLLVFAATAIVISAQGYGFESTAETTGVFDNYGNEIPPVDKAKLRLNTIHHIRAVSKAVGDAVLEEAKRLRGDNNEQKRGGY